MNASSLILRIGNLPVSDSMPELSGEFTKNHTVIDLYTFLYMKIVQNGSRWTIRLNIDQ